MRPDLPEVFDALLEPLAWGRNVYTIVRVPDALALRAREESTRRVEGSIDDVAVNVGLNRADVIADSFLYVGSSLQRRLGRKPGDVVQCRLAPADPDHVQLPEDVAVALEDSGSRDAFESKPAPERRRLLVPVEDAALPATRERRIAALIAQLPVD